MPTLTIPELRTERLLLRAWRDEDLQPFAEMGADPEVMRYYSSALKRDQSAARVRKYLVEWGTQGLGKWAVEIPGVTPFAGAVGLSRVNFNVHFAPAVEVGWRIARPFWGQGYATEAARAALDWAFWPLDLHQVVAYTPLANSRSIRVMKKLRMRYAGDFDHPAVFAAHLRKHVVYVISREHVGGRKPGPEFVPFMKKETIRMVQLDSMPDFPFTKD